MKKNIIGLFIFLIIFNTYSQVTPTPTTPTLDEETQKLLKEYQEKHKKEKTSPKTTRPPKFYSNEELAERKSKRESRKMNPEFNEDNYKKYQKEVDLLDKQALKYEEECKKNKEDPCSKILKIHHEKLKLLCKYKVLENACAMEKMYDEQIKKNPAF